MYSVNLLYKLSLVYIYLSPKVSESQALVGQDGPFNERVQTIKRQISMWAVSQTCQTSSITNKVHDTNLIRLVFLILNKYGVFTDNILSNETIDAYLKSLHFQRIKFILIGQILCVLQSTFFITTMFVPSYLWC